MPVFTSARRILRRRDDDHRAGGSSGGRGTQITEFRAGFEIRDFDIAPDGSRILFDRLRANSDVVLMDRDRRE